jgi:hypothetical protein
VLVLVLEPVVEVGEPLLAGGWTVVDCVELALELAPVLELAVEAEEPLLDKL